MKFINKSSLVFTVLLLMLAVLMSVIPSQSVDAKVFEGIGQGKHGDVKVEVTVEDEKIQSIEVLDSQENEVLAEPVYQSLSDAIIETNSVEVDVVSGSTATSEGFLQAVQDAIEKSGISLTTIEKGNTEESREIEEETYDIVIIGAGGAGLSASIEAAEAGKSVLLLEKMPAVGGNTLISGGEMNAPGNWVQEKLGISEKDSVELYYQDTFEGGNEKGDPEIIQVLAENALASAEWLKDHVGVEFYEDQLFQFGGHSVERALIPLGHTGQELVIKLKNKADEVGVATYLDTKATKLIQDENNKVVGVEATHNNGTDYKFHANDGVIITSGGFGANVEMREEANSEYGEEYLSTVSVGSTGDGLTMAEEVGAALTNMENIQTYPVSNPETGMISLLADTRFDGAILINQEGQRFVEELERRDVISKAILDQTGSYAYQLWNDELDQISQSKELHEAEYNELLESELLVVGDSIEEVAEHFDIDSEALKQTVEKVNQYAEDGKDPDFNHRSGLHSLEKGKYYLMKCKPSVHHTMGGVVINTQAQVLDTEGNVIEGLYAAGEATGVVHGENRLGGNAISDVITFGRIAGQEIAK
ncbi:flavocytochrome c [Ruoffia tabacinasalis]|uniref:Urocanate reductase n=1 Tax=Ruoffia tabacinasalis TaxID=87458 RepID=A0A5R9DSE5_9LACT|nr:flavocytochrome c [Ruoffia tabacinasalis]TLQ39608.1 flavocytochrome c [Ruoffia tabacinasalis]